MTLSNTVDPLINTRKALKKFALNVGVITMGFINLGLVEGVNSRAKLEVQNVML